MAGGLRLGTDTIESLLDIDSTALYHESLSFGVGRLSR
jgi:hypothetical protein